MKRPKRPFARAFLVAAASFVVLGSGCKGGKGCALEESEEEEQEERDQARDNYWRAQISIVGKGSVRTDSSIFDCVGDGVTQTGKCGPNLLKFPELSPPLMKASPAPGWRLDHWESLTREPDGAMKPREGRMPDGRFYLNGFGYTDTGELETVKAVFVLATSGEK